MNFTTLMAAASVNNGLTVQLPPASQSSGGHQGGDSSAANPPPSPRHYTAADIPDAFRVAAAGIINAHGLRLIRQFEGQPRTKARLCEGGAYELGAGVTFHFDGTRVQEGETCDDAYGEALFVNALKIFARAVDLYVTVPIDDNQRAALTAFAYNCGIEALKGSSLLKRVNERRFDDAAVAFGMWIYATKNGYTQALRGLLRRRYAEACLLMSLDWEEATEDDAIALQRRKPTSLPGKDEVVSKTPFHQVFAVARLHPLPPPPDVIVITDVPRTHVTDVLDVSTPNAKPIVAETLPQLEDELVLTIPAASDSGPDANGAELVRPDLPDVQAPKAEENTNSDVVLSGSPETASDPVAPQPPEASPASTLPPVLEREIIRPPLALPKPPMTIDVSKLQLNNIRVENGAKPMELSDRAIAFAIKATGVFVKIQARRGLIGMPVAETIFDIMGDAFIMGCVIAAGTWLVGRAAQTCGSLMRDHFLTTARTLTY